MSVALTCVGLSFGLVGVWLLGYDLIRGPIADWETLSLSTRLHLEHKWLGDLERRQQLDPLPLPDQADGGKWLSGAIEKSRRLIHEFENQKEQAGHEHKAKTRMWGWRGLILLTIGFVFQVLAVAL